ncbi:FAD-binding oxidoreductase [Tessaracoccus sp. MC1627]|uniref:FAD-dependent oxidoreductase n=1 Tax=Tessaracoccus sp. MC1627 TaxID=2760312 RepID=UPI0016026705|nr:FAD-dependent oxidoreductase [Tessaracoccus sp. MC1627]MBB1511844.1 FAD-binding oxidoreductase [Tessaracoccus sp. MC1627]
MAHDVVVLGASVAGLTVARRLAAEGYDVLVLDPNQEFRSAAIGHGVAAVGHASTVATMTIAYGVAGALEHARRNLAAMAEIRQIHPGLTTMTLRDSSLPGGDERETREVAELFRTAGAEAQVDRWPGGAALVTQALCVDVDEYARLLRAAAVAAGAQVVHEVTVTHLTRREGITRIGFRNNLAWVRDAGDVGGVAVIDTLGVSPWGRAARIGPAQWVPVLRCIPARPRTEVSLHATGPAWMIRPVGEAALVVGQKVSLSSIDAATAGLAEWARSELGASALETGRMAIDPSDHGRPVVGASAIPGGFYARGNGRGELMNGTASGYYLAGLLLGDSPANALPRFSRMRAYGSRLLRQRGAEG